MAAFAAPAEAPETLQDIRRWLEEFAAHVAAVDFAAARPYFAEDALGFGTYMDVVSGRDTIERLQWRAVWPTIEDFRFVLGELHVDVSADGGMACVVVPFASTGIDAAGGRFERPGRATFVLRRDGSGPRWRAVHSHLSLNRGVPQQSHGRRPPAGS